MEGKLLPPFSVIEGMGGIAAEALAVAARAETERGEKFLSKDDIRQKAKVSQTVLVRPVKKTGSNIDPAACHGFFVSWRGVHH